MTETPALYKTDTDTAVFTELRAAVSDGSADGIKEALDGFSVERIAGLLARFESDESADVIGALDEKIRPEILAALPPEKAARISRLLVYGKDTAGGMMAAEYLALGEDETLGDAVEKIRSASPDSSRAFYLYVTDDKGSLSGVVTLRDLIVKPRETRIRDIAIRSIVSIPHTFDREQVSKIFREHNFLALPVTDSENRILGIITADDVSRSDAQEATEDMLKFAGIQSDDLAIDDAVSVSLKKRLPWLVLNMLLDVVAVSVVAVYQGTIEAVVAIAVLLPIISDMGGNAGFQGLSLVVRGFALGKIAPADFWKIFRKQTIVGFITGLVLGVEIALLAYLWKWNPWFGAVAGGAMFANIYVASIVGTALPLFLKKIKIDPAVATGPLLTTITDLSGFFITLWLATRALNLIR